ncbi:DMT family transporter [Mesorhizobium sp. Z1-4]|uniref:DMT family transporter n=1 Tax=Mesorhizobium sp. Z1-4 TaxID=2448478 RepID=UPI000FD981D3|nr:DMT family transporter [Mesorhizobium sp. Z1-4]
MSVVSPTLDKRDAIDAFAAGMMIVLTLTWGLNQVAIKISNEGYNPVFLTVARSSIAAVLVFAWCRLRGIRLFENDGTLWPGIIVGAMFGLEFILIFFGLDFTTAARGTLMVNTMPFWVLIGAHFLLGERMTRVKFGGLLLAFCGVVLVFSDELSLPDAAALKGDFMLLAAGLLWGGTTLVIKRTSLAEASAEKTLLYQLLVSALVSAPLIPLAGPVLRDVTAMATASLLYQAVFVVAFTYVLWFWLMRRYPASGLSSFTFLSPVFGVLGGGLLLGEPLSWRIFAALTMIAAGLVLVNRPVRRGQPG